MLRTDGGATGMVVQCCQDCGLRVCDCREPCGCAGSAGPAAEDGAGPCGEEEVPAEAEPVAAEVRGLGAAVRTAVGKARDVTDEVRLRLLLAASGDDGMSTVEYAVGTIAAAAFGAILYQVVTGDDVVSAVTGILDDALSTSV